MRGGRSPDNSKQALCSQHRLWSLHNMKTAAHQIGVNLIRKRSRDWFGKEKWHRWHRQPLARVNRNIWIKTWPFNRAEMIVFSREKTREKRKKTTLLFSLSSRRFEAFIEEGNFPVPTPLLMLPFKLLGMIKAVTGFHQGKKHTSPSHPPPTSFCLS